ncbi:hypothetical protein ACLK1S_00385 [Escherichia coli]
MMLVAATRRASCWLTKWVRENRRLKPGSILHQQLLSGAAERVLIIVPETLQHQWLVEMLRRFNLRFALFDDERYAEAQHDAYNPFDAEQLVICSLDFARRSEQHLEHLCEAEWDLLVVDVERIPPHCERRCAEP